MKLILATILILIAVWVLGNQPTQMTGELCLCDSIRTEYDLHENRWVEISYVGNQSHIKTYTYKNNRLIVRNP